MDLMSPLLAGVAGAADDVRVRHGGRGAVGGGAGRRGGQLHLRRHPVPGMMGSLAKLNQFET